MDPRARGLSAFRLTPIRSDKIRRGVATTAVVAACGALVACGSGGSSSTKKIYLDIPRVERSIEASILSQRHLRSTVVCPSRVLQKPGTFACTATTYAAKKPHRKIETPFVVTIHNSKGYVTYIGK